MKSRQPSGKERCQFQRSLASTDEETVTLHLYEEFFIMLIYISNRALEKRRAIT